MIQRGSGTALYRAPDGSTQASAFQQNDTLVIPPNLVHQVCLVGPTGAPPAACLHVTPAHWVCPAARQVQDCAALPLPACRLSTRGRRSCRRWWCLTARQWTSGRSPTGARRARMQCGSGHTLGIAPARRASRQRCSSYSSSSDGCGRAWAQQGRNCNVSQHQLAGLNLHLSPPNTRHLPPDSCVCCQTR